MRSRLLVLVPILLLAGCATPVAEDAAPASAGGGASLVVDPERPEPTFRDVDAGAAAAPDEAATLAAPPALQAGEWWRIRMQSPWTGEDATFLRVVAAVEHDQYVIGMPHEGWHSQAVLYHVPFLGDVGLNLSGHAHDVHFEPLRFPLTPEQTWKTRFQGGPELTATVETPDAHTAHVTFTREDGYEPIRLVYDARLHEIVRFEHPVVVYEVLEHGYGFEGWVTVPRGEDLVFMHSRFIGLLGGDPVVPLPTGFGPATPTETVTLEGGYNRVTFFAVVGSFWDAPGAYRLRATAPDGAEYVVESVPGREDVFGFFEHADPDGEWTLEYLAGGAGNVFIEGVAYHQYDIHVPSGARRADHSHPVIQ